MALEDDQEDIDLDLEDDDELDLDGLEDNSLDQLGGEETEEEEFKDYTPDQKIAAYKAQRDSYAKFQNVLAEVKRTDSAKTDVLEDFQKDPDIEIPPELSQDQLDKLEEDFAGQTAKMIQVISTYERKRQEAIAFKNSLPVKKNQAQVAIKSFTNQFATDPMYKSVMAKFEKDMKSVNLLQASSLDPQVLEKELLLRWKSAKADAYDEKISARNGKVVTSKSAGGGSSQSGGKLGGKNYGTLPRGAIKMMEKQGYTEIGRAHV